MTEEQRIARLLAAASWVVVVPFAVLVARLSFERACRDPYELLRPVMQQQAGALIVASIYVAAYAWFVAAIVLIVRQGGAVGRNRWRVLVMAGVLLIDNVPRAFWTWIHAAVGVC